MTSLTILQSAVKPKRVVLVDLGYPYGKKVYMSGSVVAVAAQLMAAGHQVDIVDFNIDNPNDERVRSLFIQADIIGASVMGSPGIPRAMQFISDIPWKIPNTLMLLGGQVISRFSPEQFGLVFGARVNQATKENVGEIFGHLPSAYSISYQAVWENMGDRRLREYLSYEFALVLSQGCIFDCDFCSADKDQPEFFRDLSVFRADLKYLLLKARKFGLTGVECYASSLDFFQTPKVVFLYLEAMAEVQKETCIKLSARCLTCMNTFLAASKQRSDFSELVNRSGLWCLGFGVDGPTKEDWDEQNKFQNRMADIDPCFDLCQQMGVRAEVLTVMGYPHHTAKRLLKTAQHLSSFVRRWSNTVLRPYIARTVLPGNKGWKTQTAVVEKLVGNPQQFYNLDICGLANSTTHPNRWQRWLVNVAYLYIILRYAPFARCATSPLLPQGGTGRFAKFAKIVNRRMPFDR
ncbi:MAG: hypothetical protein P4L74_04275 [Candidatus Doudnabacteria bacterium]|nr:hypothetical protein [Candidatus Doudnabacteria bacterium]